MSKSASLVLATLLALPLVGTGIAAPSGTGQPDDAYVLSRGHSSSSNGTLEELRDLRRRYSGDFLWFRRAGREYLVRDPRLLGEAAALFDPLRELEPEQTALARKQDALGREEEALDREQDDLEREAEAASEKTRGSASKTHSAPERQQRALAERQADLARRQRVLDDEEQGIDRRQERLEKAAEARLWKLIERSIREGVASPISR